MIGRHWISISETNVGIPPLNTFGKVEVLTGKKMICLKHSKFQVTIKYNTLLLRLENKYCTWTLQELRRVLFKPWLRSWHSGQAENVPLLEDILCGRPRPEPVSQPIGFGCASAPWLGLHCSEPGAYCLPCTPLPPVHVKKVLMHVVTWMVHGIPACNFPESYRDVRREVHGELLWKQVTCLNLTGQFSVKFTENFFESM